MNGRALRLGLLLVLLALSASGCNKNNNNGVAFPFERAEHMTFTCFAPLASNDKEFVTLPPHCCSVLDPSSNEPVDSSGNTIPGADAGVVRVNGTVVLPPECQYANNQLVGTPPLMHALVTQSTRGEVAAVDLVNDKVLDSDRLVPGFTFLDTGGLPSAIVSPAVQPRIVQPPGQAADNPIVSGPQWTFVASAEEFQIRAIATCRFRSGGACGPDLQTANLDSGYQQRTRVPLPAAPRDMILGPGPTGPNQALWVTLPDLGLIARVDLAETPTVPVAPVAAGAPAFIAQAIDPFVLTTSDASAPSFADRKPKDLVFFRVPVPASVALAEPVAEGSEYTAICGLGKGAINVDHVFKPAQRTLPLAPRNEPTTEVQPNLMHFDAESGLLLVTDRVAPVLHAFTFAADGTLNALPALPTGTVVRDFVITPRVPDNTPRDLLSTQIPAEDPSSETKRYMYAIDDRGLLMFFAYLFDPSAGTATLQPLLAPTPGLNFRDRIDMPTPLTALDVIDTRSQSNWLCGEEDSDTLTDQHRMIRELPHGPVRDYKLAQVEARQTIYSNADSNYVRGVFLAAASANGTLTLLDIHDLDVSCRARKECCTTDDCNGDEEELVNARDTSVSDALAVRRHTIRRASVGQLESVIPNSQLLTTNTCRTALPTGEVDADPFYQLDSYVCLPWDPWADVSEIWSVIYHGSIPNSQTTGAAFEPITDATTQVASTDTMLMLAPAEMNLCDLGVQARDTTGASPHAGDLVAVLGNPPDRLVSSLCNKPSSNTPSTFEILEAFADHLVVTPASLTLDTQQNPNPTRTLAEIMGCYPDYVGIELRAGGFLVGAANSGTYLHRTITGPDGRCTEDLTKDPQLTSRPVPVKPLTSVDPLSGEAGALTFKNPYIEFSVAEGIAGEEQTLRNTSVQIRNGTVGLQVTSVPTGSTSADALPASLRYLPEMGTLFLLDTASQGLRRYLLQPFEYDTDSFQ